MQRRGGVHGEEVGVKKFNMTLKKNLCQFGNMLELHAEDGGQAGPLRGQSPRREGAHSLPLAAVL